MLLEVWRLDRALEHVLRVGMLRRRVHLLHRLVPDGRGRRVLGRHLLRLMVLVLRMLRMRMSLRLPLLLLLLRVAVRRSLEVLKPA